MKTSSQSSRKTLATLHTNDINDCTTTGYGLTLRADGSVRAEYSSCWQGSRSGQVYVSAPGYLSVSGTHADAETDAETDAEAILTSAIESIIDDIAQGNFNKIRVGYIIR